MGGKCSCFNSAQDHQTCDLTKGSSITKIGLSNIIANNINETKNDKIDERIGVKYVQRKINEDEIDKNLLIKAQKYLRGFLYRKKYKRNIKKELEFFSEKLFQGFMNKANENEKVRDILYTSPVKDYLSTRWSEFYEEDPTKALISDINNTKCRYKNGLIVEYSTNVFNNEDVIQCISNAKSLYKGETDIYTNKKCGYGELIRNDGSSEFGTFYNDIFQGWNRYIDKDGTLYLGLFVNNKLNGSGIQCITEKKVIYKGQFADSLKEGVGEEEGPGFKYEGAFKGNQKCGEGKIYFDSGDIYEGEFENNLFNGKGHYVWKKTGHEYIGEYSKGKFNGKGKYKWSENEYYEGDYVNGVKEGMGELKKADGKKFICPFVNGKPHGIGFFDDGKGHKQEVEFIEGKLNKKYKPKKKKA